jgi:sulfatase maturation enzyme AslB (radical SAM superfamily)
MQFIPLMEWERAAAGPEPSQFSVSAAGWGRFLNGIFDRWFPRDVRRVSIRHHDSIMELLVNGRYNVCTMSDRCGGHIVVEHNGDLYPCDFYVEPDLLLGSIHERDDETGSTALGRAVISPDLSRLYRAEGATGRALRGVPLPPPLRRGLPQTACPHG